MRLRVTVVELPARWGGVGDALADVDAVLGAGPPTDVALLPEASLTGYVSPALDFDLTRFAEPIDGATARALAELAQRHRIHLFGPLILEEGASVFNATVGFDPDGQHIMTYRKRHPWIPEEWATPGREPYPVVELSRLGAHLTSACCYDVHFLEREATRQLAAADLLLFPSAWVEEEDSRLRRLRRIATRHGIAVAAANWGPGEVMVAGQGGSCIVDGTGGVIATVAPTARRADATVMLRKRP